MYETYKKWLDEGCPKIILCTCGCGQEIIQKSKYRISKYIHGHNKANKGKHHSEEHKKKLSEANKGKHHSEEVKQKMSEVKKGEKNPSWKGGITPLNKIIRTSDKYSEWRLQIFGRDNFTCQCCGARGIYLEAHHIKTINDIIREYDIKSLDDTCEILWDLNNGITYCTKCHEKLKKKGGILEII